MRDTVSRALGTAPRSRWRVTRGEDWSPIPGTTRPEHLEEDLGALDVQLSPEQVQRLTDITPAVGDHHTEAQLQLFDR